MNSVLFCGFTTNSHFVRVSNKSDNIAPYARMRQKSVKYLTYSFFLPSHKKPYSNGAKEHDKILYNKKKQNCGSNGKMNLDVYFYVYAILKKITTTHQQCVYTLYTKTSIALSFSSPIADWFL